MSVTVVACGRLTRNPDIKYLDSGTIVANFSIAVSDGKDHTSFFDCVSFDKKAEVIANFTKKGDRIVVHGTLKQERWESEQGKRSKIKITVNVIDLIETKAEAGANAASSPPEEDTSTDDIKF